MVNGRIFPISKEIQASMKRIIGMRIGAIHSRGTLIAGVLKKELWVACSRSNSTRREERVGYVILLT
jgi:hypothetical protein